ncbi:MAG TPA: RHS repeat-associated core domain-containing protein, partial [Solirubrobacterales bacterium]|nr:RHS repeat-associated core domain-containing protein [Solirubrobacterales bacterium]
IANNHFALGSSRSAIYYTAGEGQTGNVNIHGNYVEGGKTDPAISVKGAKSAITATTLSGNTIIGNESSTSFNFEAPEIPGDITENTLSGNKSNLLQVSGTVAHSSTWKNGGTAVKLGAVTIPSEVTLNIEPGLNFKTPHFTIKGTLLAEGTTEAPILFTEGSGNYTPFLFEPGSGASVLNRVQISNAGSEFYVKAPIQINKSSPTIENSVLANSAFWAIWIPEGGSPVIANNIFLGIGRSAIYYTAGEGQTGNINIHGNFIEGGKTDPAISVKGAKSAITATTLSGNTVVGNESSISFTCEAPEIPGDITENTLVSNKSNLIQVSGTVAKSSTWKNGNTRVKPSGVTVASGATLTIAKGVLMVNPSFIVKGTLNTEGTAAEPVVFTGLKEEGAGEWGSVKFEAGSGSSVVSYAEFAYGGKESVGMVEAKGSHPTITNSTFRKGIYGIKVTESGSPRIEWDRFRGNTSGGLSYSGTGELSAPNNDWGCANGPKPAGCGDSVTKVAWKPAVQLPELAGHCRGKESQCGEGADPVSLATGALNYSHRDLLLTNKSSEPLEFTRAYYSGSSADTGLGPGWSQTGLASVTELESGEVLVLRQDGRQDLFQKTESGYKAPSGVTDTLAKVEGTFQLTTLDQTVYRFDASGRIASITDAHGLKTTYAYNAEGRLATITDPSGQTLTFAYNASNHITSVKDSTGREVKFGYSAAGDLESVTDALGGVTKYAYDSQHRITSITDPRGNVILKNTYDSQGRITEQRDGLEHLWKLSYGSGQTTVTEPEGGKITYGFDSQNRVVSETDQLGNKTTTVYDSAGNVSEVIHPGGAKWSFGHDAAGNLTSVKDPEGGERKYEYDAKNRLTKFTDARGDSWGYEWSAANDLTKVTDPEGGETTLTYNESGQPLTLTDADKHKTEFGWDTRGNRLSVTDPFGHKTSFEYNSRNYLTSETKPGLKAETFERDALGDMLSQTTPEGHKTKYAYDANGLPTQITDPAEDIWKIAYNAMERPTTYTDPAEQQTTVAYNGNLRPTKVTNRRGKETTYAYDLANRLTEVHAPEGGNWTFGYDARGNRTSVVDPREHKTTYEYDLLDRMKKASEPLEATTEYGYDANGDLTSVKDPRGNTTSYAYDKLGRLTEVAQPLEKTTSFAYDAAGNMLSRATAVGAVEYGYDAANRLTKVSSGESPLRSFGYDAANRLTEATDAEGHKIGIGYTEEGRVASMNDGRGQSLTRSYNSRGQLTKQVDGRGTLEYGYDKLGRLTSLTDPQGKTSSFGYDPEGDLTEVKRPGGIVTTNLYDNAGRLSEATTEAGEPPAVLEALKYSYDPAGNLVKRIDSRLEQETSYAYDALNHLTEFNPPGEGSTAYAYDAAGNRTEASGTTYTYNALNQLTGSSDGTTYGYDSAGRLTNEAKESEKTTYTWDPLDHLAKVEGPTETASYAYDALERLSERSSEAGTQVFHYGDLGDLATFDANGEGKTTTSYVQGARGLFEQRSGETTSYPLADAHGDITAMVNGAGEVTSRQSYDPWGAQLSGPSLEMGFLGAQERRADPSTGLIQMGARSYSPALGRFLSEDPVYGHLGIGASADRYLYVWDNPLNRYDLNGRDVCAPTPWGDACAGDAAEDAGNAASEAWETGKYLVTHPGEAATNAVNYWAESESPASYIFGPLATLGDMGLNPDRIGYYLDKVSPAQMAATGLAAAATVGFGGLTVMATDACYGVAAPLEALHTCTFVATTGMTMTAGAGYVTIESARK